MTVEVEGLQHIQQDQWAKKLQATEKVVSNIESGGKTGIEIFNAHGGASVLKKLKLHLSFLSRCAELEKQFKSVTLDAEAVRTIRDESGHNLTVQLIFRAGLPAKLVSKIRKEGHYFKAKTPSPPPEAMQAISEHGKLFDGLEIWWVPKEIIVEKIPDPDPILIGRIGEFSDDDEKAMNNAAFFELHRWIDDSVEDGWWSKEAY